MSAKPEPQLDDFLTGFGEWLEEQRAAFWAAGGPSREEADQQEQEAVALFAKTKDTAA